MARNSIIPPSPSEETYAVDEDQGDVFTHDDPFALFEEWFAKAIETEPNDPGAMALATTGRDGLPDVRMVLLKDASESGLTFYSSQHSAKGVELSENPKAALCFHWKSIRRQVRFRGTVEEVSPNEADAYFATRAKGAQVGAWASKQSTPLSSPDALKKTVAEFEAKFEGADTPRPDYWTGFRVVPTEIEFWVNRPYRLHDRRLFKREMSSVGWRALWLNP